MRIIAESWLHRQAREHAGAERPTLNWIRVVRRAKWQSMVELRQDFPSADPLDGECVIFNIGDNNRRLFCKVWFPARAVFTRWFGTHAQCDRLTQRDIRRICMGGPDAPTNR